MLRFIYVILLNLFRAPYMIPKMRREADHPEKYSAEERYELARHLSGYTRMPSQVCNTKSVLTNQAGHINSFIYGSRSFTYFAALLRRSSSIAA